MKAIYPRGEDDPLLPGRYWKGRKILDFYEETVWKNDGWYIESNRERQCLQEPKDTLISR